MTTACIILAYSAILYLPLLLQHQSTSSATGPNDTLGHSDMRSTESRLKSNVGLPLQAPSWPAVQWPASGPASAAAAVRRRCRPETLSSLEHQAPLQNLNTLRSLSSSKDKHVRITP